MNDKIHVFSTLDCGSDIGETLFIYGKNRKEVLKIVWDIFARTQWRFKEQCTYQEMLDYMFNCPLADAINCDSDYPEIDIKQIIRHYKFRNNIVKSWSE